MAEQKVDLRKTRDFSDNINDTILFIRQNFKPLLTSFLLIAGIFMLTSSILNGLYQSQWGGKFQDILTGRSPNPSSPFDMINKDYFLVILAGWLNFVAMQVAVISYIKVYENNNGETPSIQDVWNVFRTYFLKVFFFSIPIALMMLIGFFLCLVPGIYLAIVFVPFPIILIAEGKSFGGAFSRCFELIKNNFWISFGIYLLTYIISAFSGGMISLLVSAVGGFISYFTTRDINATAGVAVSLLNIFGFIFYIIYYLSVSLHYFNLVERHDGTGMMRKLDSLGGSHGNFDNIQEQY